MILDTFIYYRRLTAAPGTGYHFVQWSDASTQNPRTDTNVTASISVTASFAINTYTLTYTAGANGVVSGYVPQTVNYGGSGTAVTAGANAHYHFVNWSDASTQNPRTDTNVTADISVTANFAITTHTLTYTAGANGAISGTPSQTVNDGADGSAVTAVPSVHYQFVNWSDASTQNPRTDSNVTADISVTANFAITTHTLTYTAGANGAISGTPSQTVNDGADGSAVTAVPSVHYQFVNWSDASTQNPRTDSNVTADISVTANFAITTHTLTYTAGANGAISGTSPQTVNDGADGSAVTAVPNAHYHFVNWSDASTQNPRTDTNVTADISVTANFSIIPRILTYTAGANGNISGASPQTVNDGADGSAVTAVPNAHYHFVNWSDASTQNPRTDTNVTADISVTASFGIDTFTLTYAAGANGSLSGTSPQTVNYGASGTAVTAGASAHYHFVNWSDTSTQNPRTDTNVTAGVSVTANFAITTHTLTYTAGANGTISGTSPQTVNDGADGAAITAMPSTGYHFVNWSDASTQNPRTDTNVTADISVTANFSIIPRILTYTAGANGNISGASPQTVNDGADGSAVTAAPNAHYHFVNWSDSSTLNPRTDLAVSADVSVTANFAITTHTLTYTAGAGGTISGASSQTVNDGASGTAVTAAPSSGFGFTQWSDGILTATRTDANVTANISVTATFARNTAVLTLIAGANGTLAAVETPPYLIGQTVQLTATPDPGSLVQAWTGADTEPSAETTNTVTMATDKTVSVQFVRLFPCDTDPISGNKIWDIEANELSSYVAAWLNGAAWPIAPVNIPANYVSRAVAIWLNGEKYTNTGGDEPLCWALPSP